MTSARKYMVLMLIVFLGILASTAHAYPYENLFSGASEVWACSGSGTVDSASHTGSGYIFLTYTYGSTQTSFSINWVIDIADDDSVWIQGTGLGTRGSWEAYSTKAGGGTWYYSDYYSGTWTAYFKDTNGQVLFDLLQNGNAVNSQGKNEVNVNFTGSRIYP